MISYTVQEWMTPSPLTVTPETSLTEADVMMEARWIRHLPVVEDNKPVGMLSLGDIREAKATMNASTSADEPLVRDLITPEPITVPGMTTMALAAQTMLQAHISSLPVVDDDGFLTGILSETDVLRLFIEESKMG